MEGQSGHWTLPSILMPMFVTRPSPDLAAAVISMDFSIIGPERDSARAQRSDWSRDLRLKRREPKWLEPIGEDDGRVRTYSDSDWAGRQKTRQSTSGGSLRFGVCMIKQAGAEVYAATRALCEAKVLNPSLRQPRRPKSGRLRPNSEGIRPKPASLRAKLRRFRPNSCVLDQDWRDFEPIGPLSTEIRVSPNKFGATSTKSRRLGKHPCVRVCVCVRPCLQWHGPNSEWPRALLGPFQPRCGWFKPKLGRLSLVRLARP